MLLEQSTEVQGFRTKHAFLDCKNNTFQVENSHLNVNIFTLFLDYFHAKSENLHEIIFYPAFPRVKFLFMREYYTCRKDERQ